MGIFKRHLSTSGFQVFIYAQISMAVILMTVIETYSGEDYFSKYFYSLPPLFVVTAISILGGIVFYLLCKGYRCFILNPAKPLLEWPIVIMVLACSTAAILIDCSSHFSEDINVPLPHAFLFYPVMGFVVEILFHTIPLYLLLRLTLSSQDHSTKNVLWILILIVSVFEPTFQILFMDSLSFWAIIMVWINVYVLNLIQLYTFLNIGFLSMFSLRMIYYMVWHILWGSYRIDVLF